MLGDLLGDVGLGLVATGFAPDDQPHLSRERVAERHRPRLAFVAAAPHIRIMTSLDDTDKATVAELLRETIERDRFPLSPRIKSLKAILDKLEPPAPRPTPHHHPSHRASEAWRWGRSGAG
jgi:hypothetical protein